MKFALVNGERKEAVSNLKGHCVGCLSPMVARCGEVRINHWAHQSRARCDLWWEPETEWHRSWKNQFPNEWQEVVHYADSGEKHIADIKTTDGWVLEFQHSYINPEERRSRENFYEKLIWVVDGNRRIKDKTRFFEVLVEGGARKNYPNLRSTFPEGALFRDWIQSTAHVLFDFGDEDLWWLLPQSNDFYALVLPIKRQQFVAFHRENSTSSENEFEILFKKFDLKIPDPTSSQTLTLPSTDLANVHPNTILGLMNNRRRFRL